MDGETVEDGYMIPTKGTKSRLPFISAQNMLGPQIDNNAASRQHHDKQL